MIGRITIITTALAILAIALTACGGTVSDSGDSGGGNAGNNTGGDGWEWIENPTVGNDGWVRGVVRYIGAAVVEETDEVTVECKVYRGDALMDTGSDSMRGLRPNADFVFNAPLTSPDYSYEPGDTVSCDVQSPY